MNYLWEVAVKAKQNNISAYDLIFKGAESFSPYAELSFVDINTVELPPQIEINPYYRFFSIFKNFFHPDFGQYNDLRLQLFDIIVQHINTIDVLQGMNRRDYYIKFIVNDLRKGALGERVRQNFECFNFVEEKIIANNLLNLYDTGEAVYLLKDSIRKIFPQSIILAAKEKDELVFFMREKETEQNHRKVELIQDLFMPLRFAIEIYWENIFGIVEVDELMKIDSILNY